MVKATKLFTLLAVCTLAFGCQHKASETTTTSLPAMIDRDSAKPQNLKLNLQQILNENPVILDARAPFDFNMAHVPQSVNVRWEDFSQADPHSRGLLDADLFGLARRLSLIGIDPKTSVLILGKGKQGLGEEGRIAWTLQVLGVRKVYLLNYEELRSTRNQESPLPLNRPYWKPEVDESLTVEFETFKNLVTGQAPSRLPPTRARSAALQLPPSVAYRITTANIFGMPMDEAVQKLVVVDVRPTEQFSLENLKQKKEVQAPVENIDWREFFDDQGLVSAKVEEKLLAHKITKDSVIFVISNHGVRSGAVTYALRVLGYNRSANFAGGYEQWNVKK